MSYLFGFCSVYQRSIRGDYGADCKRSHCNKLIDVSLSNIQDILSRKIPDATIYVMQDEGSSETKAEVATMLLLKQAAQKQLKVFSVNKFCRPGDEDMPDQLQFDCILH